MWFGSAVHYGSINVRVATGPPMSVYSWINFRNTCKSVCGNTITLLWESTPSIDRLGKAIARELRSWVLLGFKELQDSILANCWCLHSAYNWWNFVEVSQWLLPYWLVHLLLTPLQFLALGAHAQRGLYYLVCVSVCLSSVCYHVFCHHTQQT